MKDLKFKVKNEAHSKAIQERLFELGYRWMVNGRKPSHLSQPYLLTNTYSQITYGETHECYSTDPRAETTLDELFEETKEIVIELNGEYKAIITDVVKVGCQEFSFDIIKKLYKAIKKQQYEN